MMIFNQLREYVLVFQKTKHFVDKHEKKHNSFPMSKFYLLFLAPMLFLASCQKEPTVDGTSELDTQLEEILNDFGGKAAFVLPESEDLAAIPQDPKNPLTKEKVALGQLLFHETGLALNPRQEIGKGTYSCASCHFAAAGFQAGRFQAIAEGGMGFGVNGEERMRNNLYIEENLDVQPMRSPSAMNGAYQKNLLWNGQFGATGVNIGTEEAWTADTPKETNHLGFEGLETQAIAGLEVHRMEIEESFLENNNYKDLFDAAFPGISEADRYDKIRAGLAIAAYERTLLANKAPFQDWLKGEAAAMSDEEKRGAILFFGKAQCASCHTGPALNKMEFHALGMHDIYSCPEETFKAGEELADHLGRGGFTGIEADQYKFKVPQLYNLSDSPFYGHGSSFRTIKEVVVYKNQAIAENPKVPAVQLTDFQPLGLSNDEIDHITAFLTTALKDADLKRYEPESILSGNCFPNNDAISRYDLGCN